MRNFSIKEEWWEFHRQNMHVYELFKHFSFEVIKIGHKNFSSKAIFERIRWETAIKTTDEQFKLQNNFTPYYARLFMTHFPEHDGFFRTREVNGDNNGN